MKLSEAIRTGAQFRDLYDTTLSFKGGEPCGCLVGTTLYVMGEKDVMGDKSRYDLLRKHFPIMSKIPNCPVCDGDFRKNPNRDPFSWTENFPGMAMECLYECHGWSKKAIAEWVEVIENKLEYGAEKAHAVVHQDVTAPVRSS